MDTDGTRLKSDSYINKRGETSSLILKLLKVEFKIKGERITADEINYLTSLGLKWCNKCKSVKNINGFGSDKSRKDGLEYVCKECRKSYATERRETNPERVREIRRISRNKHAEESRNKKKEWAENNRDHIRDYKRQKYNNDPNYKLAHACRQLVKRMFKSTGVKKCYKTEEILGYTPLDLKQHIENKFKEGMSWSNYGEWHIDHVIPISLARNLEEGIKLSKLENLQPLWAKENISKGNKLGEE